MRSGFRLHHLLLVIVGGSLTALLVPHMSPWVTTNVRRVLMDDSIFLAVRLPFVASSFLFSMWTFVAATLFLLFLVGLSIPSDTYRALWRSVQGRPRVFLSVVLSVEFFLITLIPAEPNFTSQGPAVITYLILSTLGLALFFLGFFPIMRTAFEQERLLSVVTRFYTHARYIVVESPIAVYLIALMLFELMVTNVFSLVLFERIPHVQDSIAQLFHSKIFAEGTLTAPAPLFPEFFDYRHIVIRDGHWYSQYPPGHSFLLMLGSLVGAPWLINPLFAALVVGIVYFLGKELYNERVGRIAALLTSLSPFILFMSSEFMNHTTALFFFLMFLLYVAKSLRNGSFLHGFLAGTGLGMLVNIRPYSAAALAVPVFLLILIVIFKDRSRILRPFLGFLLSSFLFLGILLAFNTLTNGHPLVFGFQALWGTKVNPGFGKGAWGAPHSPLNGLLQTFSNFDGINKYLFEWPVPSLLFVAILFMTGTRNRWDFVLLGTFLSLAFAYFFYWFQDWCFGPRFLFEASVPLILLTARGIESLPLLWRDVLGFKTSIQRVRIASLGILLLLFGIGFASNIPPHMQFYGNTYWGVNAKLLREVEARGISNAVIFVRANYGNGFIGNDPFFRKSVIYANDLGDENRRLMAAFPGYRYYRAIEDNIQPLTLRE